MKLSKVSFLIFLMFLICTSCKLRKVYNPDFEYMGEANYHNFYIVDTITIESPVVMYIKNGWFVFSKELLFKGLKLDYAFTMRPDVFLIEFEMPIMRYNENSISYIYLDDGGCDINNWLRSEVDDNQFFEFKEKDIQFILGLMNVNFHNRKYNSLHGNYLINFKEQKSSYFKIVFPLCM